MALESRRECGRLPAWRDVPEQMVAIEEVFSVARRDLASRESRLLRGGVVFLDLDTAQ